MNKTLEKMTLYSSESSYIDRLEKSINEGYFHYYERSEFINLTLVTTGGYSSIYRAKWKNTNSFCALKFYNMYYVKELVNEVCISN